MSLEDDTKDAYKARQKIRPVHVQELERDWRNRMDYFRREYENAVMQYEKLSRDMMDSRLDLRAWFDPNERLYFYEKHIIEEQGESQLQKDIDKALGITKK